MTTPVRNPLQNEAPYIGSSGFLVVPNPTKARALEEAKRVKIFLPCLVVEVLDAEGARDINPLLGNGAIVACAHALTESVTVGDALKFSPAPEGSEPTRGDCVDKASHDLLLAATGVDDDGSRSAPEFAEQGLALAKQLLARAPASRGVHLFTKAREASEASAVDIVRSFGGSPEQCSQLIGREVRFPRRSMLVPLSRSDVLAAEQEQQKAEAARLEADRIRIEAERAKPNTLSLKELGLEAIRVRRPDQNPFQGVPLGLQYLPSWYVGDGLVFAWRSIPGFSLHGLTLDGATVCPSSFVITAPLHDIVQTPYPRKETFDLLVELVRAFGKGDRGPIPNDRWSKDGLPVVEKLIEEWAHALDTVKDGMGWIPRHMLELSVRGALVRTDLAAAIWHEKLKAMFEARKGTKRVPKARRAFDQNTPIDPASPYHKIRESALGWEDVKVDPGPYKGLSRETLIEWAEAAAEGGIVEPGSLLRTKSEVEKTRKAGK